LNDSNLSAACVFRMLVQDIDRQRYIGRRQTAHQIGYKQHIDAGSRLRFLYRACFENTSQAGLAGETF
jgi:hypothetical protein